MNEVDLYLQFRAELDKMFVPDLLKCFEVIPITGTRHHMRQRVDEKKIGLLCVAHMDGWEYIDCLYLLPEYRRSGIGKAAALKFYKENKGKEIRLHIIRSNTVAHKFWKSIFELELIEENEIDGLYKIRRLKK